MDWCPRSSYSLKWTNRGAPMAQPRIYSKGESIGPYEVVRVMATGGMSVVYEAISLRPYVAAPTDDVWALGVILYEALAGESPWRTPPERRELLFREIQTVKPPHPSEVYKRAPRALGDVAMLMLEKNPGKRPASASAALSLL